MTLLRRLPMGAEPQPGGGVHFRVWAPKRTKVEVVFATDRLPVASLTAEEHGYFSGFVAAAKAGDAYRYRVDGEGAFPDPASRFQPEGPHGPSQIEDPKAFRWTDHGWKGKTLKGQVIYEMHIGTFTPGGTWASACEELPYLAELGITVLEVMPVADFVGNFGWGYDGVNMFAPCRLFGTPNDFRDFVDRAHALGMGVILDVVYNHFGPSGNYVREFSDYYFSTRYKNEWGDPINFDDQHAQPVREYFASNAAYWIDEFHLDGLRLDATQQIFDASPEHILKVICDRARAAAKPREIFIVSENERQEAKQFRAIDKGGYGLDGMWNDDFHHSARVALTSHGEAYYTDHQGKPQEFISAAKWGFLYQGQHYRWQKARRGFPALDLCPEQFVVFIENHDQVSNSGDGQRPRHVSSPGRFRTITALMLLSPGTPMLFQGQEFGATTPFQYFADHEPELAAAVQKGRLQFLTQFPSLATPEMQQAIPDPGDVATYERCKLKWEERESNTKILQFHRDLLRLRHDDPAFRDQQKRGCDGAVLGEKAFVLRYFVEDGDDRLLFVNLAGDLHFDPAPEPLLAPPEGKVWGLCWSSNSVEYGGLGTPALETEENWRIPGEAAVVLKPVPIKQES